MSHKVDRKKIACFQCGALGGHDEQFCPACGFDIASEISDRQTSCLYLRLAAGAFAIGTLAPVVTLFAIGEFSSRLLPVLAVVAILLVVAGCAWLWADHIEPKYVLEPSSEDLRSRH